jgi:photosystem II stability/assembly factor-like uncharacterized protein
LSARKSRRHLLYFSLLLAVFAVAVPLAAQAPDDSLLREFQWRNLGPGNFAGRVVDVEALDADYTHVVVASASGGVWKSTNAGITWTSIFDNYPSASIGDVAIFQRDPNILWVGTGEANNRNSVAWGDGIYKSTDGGKTFTHAGLRDTYQIARIITHPTDPNIVYVAAIGNLWGYTGDRGLFKTTDGGKTWTKLAGGLPDDGKTGAIDLVMDPSNAETLYVALYQRLRRPWQFESGGPNGGIFKTTNGGRTWTKLTQGLPEGDTGRIGLDIYRKNPKILVAIIEHGFQPREDDPAYTDMSKLGTGIYRSEDGGKTWKFLNRYNNRPFYYSQIRINPVDDQRVYVLTTTFRESNDGGRTFRAAPLSFEGGLDFHAMWLDPANRDRYWLGKDKGLTLTYDHGEHFVLFDNMPLAQFYAIGVDHRDPYFVCGGTQDNGTWCGPSFSKDVRGIQNDSWWKLHWGDGMFIQIDPADWRKAYTEAENGSVRRYDMETRRVQMVEPGPENIIGYREQFPNEARPGDAARAFRFNWRAPLVMSPHNGSTLFLGGNFLFKTVDGGLHWQIISPDLSTNDRAKWDVARPGGLTRDATGAETHCSITAISESPLVPGLIWVGTDDGNVQVTRDGGATWTNVRKSVPGVPDGIWVSSLEASHFEPGTAYVTFDGHRSADFRTWVFRTADYGATWTSVAGNLPADQPLYVVREDLKNKDLLFAGSEFALFVSLDSGKQWARWMNGMPTVAVHDLVIHPRDNDLVAGTHGRGIFILDDITPLQQLTDAVRNAPAHVFQNRPATIWEDASRGGVRGHFFFAAENPPYIPKRDNVVRAKLINGALIHYYLKARAGDVRIEVSEITGQKKRTLFSSAEPGIHRALWDLRFDPTPEQVKQFVTRVAQALDRIEKLPSLTSAQKEVVAWARKEISEAGSDDERLNAVRDKLMDEFADAGALPRFFGRLQGEEAGPGEYLVTLHADGKSYTSTLTVRPDPILGENGK